MIITTTEQVPGFVAKKYLGLVWSSTVRSKHIGWDIQAMLKSLAGGEIPAYKRMLNEARDEVLKGLAANAKKLKANAVVGVKFEITQIMPTMVEVVAYGTAVSLQKA
jgi:uncharacterized protein YbjQ (UPF0145 family)